MNVKKYNEIIDSIAKLNEKQVEDKLHEIKDKFNIKNKSYDLLLSTIKNSILRTELNLYYKIKRLNNLPRKLEFNENDYELIYKNKDCTIYTDYNKVYKFSRNKYGKLEGYIHEGIIGLYGTNKCDGFCKVLDVYKDNDFIKNHSCVVLEYCKGKTLSKWLCNKQNKRVKNVINSVIMSMYNAFMDISFCHHDLHLLNIIVDEQDNIKIIDFGRSCIIYNNKNISYPLIIQGVNHFYTSWIHDMYRFLTAIFYSKHITYSIKLFVFKLLLFIDKDFVEDPDKNNIDPNDRTLRSGLCFYEFIEYYNELK